MKKIDKVGIFISIFMLVPFPFWFANNPRQIIGGYIIGSTIVCVFWAYRFIFGELKLSSFKFSSKNNSASIDELTKMAKLKEGGHITEEEFNEFKKKILN